MVFKTKMGPARPQQGGWSPLAENPEAGESNQQHSMLRKFIQKVRFPLVFMSEGEGLEEEIGIIGSFFYIYSGFCVFS